MGSQSLQGSIERLRNSGERTYLRWNGDRQANEREHHYGSTGPMHFRAVPKCDSALIAGTHGRSAWIVDALPLQQLDADVRNSAVHLFHIDDLKPSRDWRRRPEHLPELTGTYWAKAAGPVRFRLLDEKDRPLATFEREAQVGLNSFKWNLALDTELTLAAEKQALEALDADKREELKHQPYAESQRLGHRLYPVPGKYTLEIAQADTTSRSGFEIEAPKPQDPRWTPPFKLRGEDADGRHQDEERPHPRAGARARGGCFAGEVGSRPTESTARMVERNLLRKKGGGSEEPETWMAETR